MHTLRRRLPASEQTDAAHTDHAHAGHAEVPRRAAGPAAGAAHDRPVLRPRLPRHARRGRAHRAGARRRGARQRRALQVLRQELPRRVLAHHAPPSAHGRPALQM